jgi:hypothetical protein
MLKAIILVLILGYLVYMINEHGLTKTYEILLGKAIYLWEKIQVASKRFLEKLRK